MKQKIISIVFATVFLLLLALPVEAQEYCEGIYGGGQTCKKGVVSLDKQVKNPANGLFVENLGTDNSFNADDEIEFKLRLTNTGDYKIDTVAVTDTLPSYLVHLSGPTADDVKNLSYDGSSRVLRFDLEDLEKDETRELYFKAKVVSQDNLASGTVCQNNQAYAQANGRSDQDTAQVCMVKKVLGQVTPQQLPKTGPNDGWYFLLEALGFALTGIMFLKLAKIKKIR